LPKLPKEMGQKGRGNARNSCRNATSRFAWGKKGCFVVKKDPEMPKRRMGAVPGFIG
jgi:hypothetical protein